MRWVLSFGLLGAVGCAAEDGREAGVDVEEEQAVEVAQQGLMNMPYRGGPGGNAFTAPIASFGYNGFAIRAGTRVDQLKPHYYNPHTHGSAYGGTGGTDLGWQNCPNWLVGIYTRSDTYVNQIGLICGDVDHTNNLVLGPFGTMIGTYNLDLCPVGQVVRQIKGRAGSRIDGIRILCGIPNT